MHVWANAFYYFYFSDLYDYWQRFLLYYLVLEADHSDSMQAIIDFCTEQIDPGIYDSIQHNIGSANTHTVLEAVLFSYPPL